MKVTTTLAAWAMAALGACTCQAAIYTYDINPFQVTLANDHTLWLSGTVSADSDSSTNVLVSSDVYINDDDGTTVTTQSGHIYYPLESTNFALVATETTLTLHLTQLSAPNGTTWVWWSDWHHILASVAFFTPNLLFLWEDDHAWPIQPASGVAGPYQEVLLGTRTAAEVPEPAALLLWSLGLASVASSCVYRRARHRGNR